MLFVLGKN